MRIIVMSDSHGRTSSVNDVVNRNLGKADIFIHLGDGESELSVIRKKYPYLDLRNVAGNCDYASMLSQYLIVDVDGARIFCAHGHKYFVKSGTETIRSIARDNDCNVVLFGHTHIRYETYEDGIYLLNPGSCAVPRDGKSPSYGYVDVTKQGIVTNIVSL